MESVLFKYSDFFQDDGGMQKVKNDFAKLGDELVNEAKKVKKEINSSFNFDDLDNFDKLEKRIEELSKANEDYLKAKSELVKIEEEIVKAQKDEAKSLEKLTKAYERSNSIIEKSDNEKLESLARLGAQIEVYKSRLSQLQKQQKSNARVNLETAQEIEDLKLNIKDLTSEYNKNQKEILEQGKLTAREIKYVEALNVIENKRINTLEQVRERMSALRLVVQSLDLVQEADKIREYNQEIDELTEILSDNSDQFIQNKINIGNYEESINKALKESSLFKTQISQLDGVLSQMTSVLFTTKQEAQALEEAMGQNTTAVQRFTIAFGKMNKVLKASVIGLVLVALGALASMFGNTRAGAVNMEKAMLTLSSTFVTFGRISMAIIKGLGGAILELVQGNFKKAKEAVTDSFEEIAKASVDTATAIIQGFEFINRAFQIEDQVRQLNRELEKTNKLVSIYSVRAGDSTRSLNTMLLYAKKLRIEQEKLGEQQKEIANLELEAINNRIKQQAIANGLAGSELNINQEGYAFAEATQRLAREKGVDLKLGNELIEEQAQAMLKILEIETETAVKREENAKELRQINQDLFEQNLDLLIDIIDTEKNISEAFVNNTKKNFQARLNEFNRFIIRFRENAQLQIEEFNTLFEKQAKTLGEKAPKLSLKFDDENNVKVFLDGVELSLDQSLGTIQDLNKQLQKAGIAEIPINRFREFLVEARNGKRDFDNLAISVKEFGFALKELEGQIDVQDFKSEEFLKIEERLKELSSIKFTFFQQSERNAVEKEIEKLEKRREELAKETDKRIMENRINSIQEMLDSTYQVTEDGVKKEKLLYEKGSEERTALEKELLELKIGLREKDYQDLKDKTDEQIKKEKEAYERFTQEVRRITSLVVDKVVEINQKRVQLNESLVDKQKDAVDRQEERARQGMTNTLAFEEEQLAKREAELIKSQKKAERLEKIKALWTSYSSYADKEKDPNQALFKALRDFAVLEAITASFGDGGIVGIDGVEKVRTDSNGITIGRSHNMRKGILAYHEGGEGFFSRKEIANMGEGTFRTLKEMAGSGALSENFFTKQKDDFVSYVIPKKSVNDTAVLNELRSVKEAIEKKPVQTWDLVETSEGILEYIEKLHIGNRTIKNHYRSKRKRI